MESVELKPDVKPTLPDLAIQVLLKYSLLRVFLENLIAGLA